MPDNVRKPSGCVTVEDNNLQIYDPVREVQVMASRSQLFGFIFHRSAYTNEKGCWQINHNYSGKIHVWVKFESATCNIKTMNGAIDLWGYTFPRKAYIGKYGGPNFNNIGIQFDWTNNIDTRQFRNWVASTINNSIYETQRFNTFNGLPHPPGNLKILVTPWGFQTGMVMANLRYGAFHSNGGLGTWQRRIETSVFNELFIPAGWQYDLLDDNSQNPGTLTEPLGVNNIQIIDNVLGFTRLEIFNTMTSSMLSIEQQKEALMPLLVPKGLTIESYNALSSGYGF